MRTLPLGLALVALLAGAAAATAGSPTEQLRRYTDRVVAILEDRSLTPASRQAAVQSVAREVFAVEETARRALGRHWQGRTPAERAEFVELFADLLERTYIGRLDEYGGERVRYVSERVDGSYASVQARIVTRRGVEVPVESRLLQQDGRWLIYDVLIEGVSLVGNYRSQFDRIVRSGSYGELVRRLREKLADPSGRS
jgi:phospholipid transport system substrate-binding protein